MTLENLCEFWEIVSDKKKTYAEQPLQLGLESIHSSAWNSIWMYICTSEECSEPIKELLFFRSA